MNIRIKTTNYKLTPEVADYLNQRLKALGKFIGRDEDVARCEVEIGRAQGHSEHGDVWRAEINLIHAGVTLRAEAVEESINASIDKVKDEVIRQLKREKRLHIRLARRGGKALKNMLRGVGNSFGSRSEE